MRKVVLRVLRVDSPAGHRVHRPKTITRCHPGESRGLYSRGRRLWTPAFAGVTIEVWRFDVLQIQRATLLRWACGASLRFSEPQRRRDAKGREPLSCFASLR